MKSSYQIFIWIIVLLIVIGISINYWIKYKEGLDTTPVTTTTTPVTTTTTPVTTTTTPVTTKPVTTTTTIPVTTKPVTTTTTIPVTTTTPNTTMTPGITTTPTTTIASAYGNTTPPSNTINYVQQPIPSEVMLISHCTGDADVNNYIQYAIQYANAGDINNVLSNLQSAITTQSDLGNDAVVQLLSISNTFFTNYQTNANGNSKTITVWNQGKSMLLGAQQILSAIASAFSYDYGGNLQAAVFALNPIQKDTATAMNYLNNAISVQTTNGNRDAAIFLRQAVSFLRDTNQTVLNNSITSLQAALYEIASALANLNVKYREKTSTVCTDATAPPIPTKAPIPTISADSSGNWWKSQFHMNVPQVIQNFLDARSIYNDSVNNLNIYLQEKGNYDSVIISLQNVQNELNNL
jgi:hypothetical protein